MQRDHEIDLSGSWRFRPDPDDLGEHYPERLDIPWSFDARWMNLDHDDSAWAEINVPSCWQQSGYSYNGVAWYRTYLPPLPAEAGRRTWLRFAGVDYFSDAWLNEIYLGSHEGFFSAFEYEVTPCLHPDRNLLAVRVDSPNDISAKERQYGQLKGMIKGALQRWDVNNPEVNPGGIWNDVRLYSTGPGAIRDLRLQTLIDRLPEARHPSQPVPASLLVNVTVAGPSASAAPSTYDSASLVARLSKRGEEAVLAQATAPIRLLPGSFTWVIALALDRADLWYTWDLGLPVLYELEVTLEVDGEASDRARQTFGFRTLERGAGWETYLNGIRFYQRGTNYLSDQFLSSMDEDRYARDVALLREANLNTVHPFAVVEKQVFYDLCDRLGLLVYQDFPMWLTMNNTSDLVRRAEQQLRELVDQFHHHPSIGIWNFGSQPSVANFEKLGARLAQTARQLDPSRITHQANSLTDHTGNQPDPVDDYKWHPRRLQEFQAKYDWRVDTHQYYGWYYGDLKALHSVPLQEFELVTEYGAQALPSAEHLRQFIPEGSLFPPVWSAYTRRCFQPEMQFQFIPQPASLEGMVADSQSYQARFIQYHTETYRLLKFAPNNGAHYFCFNDCWPAITWSVVDYDRNKKPGFFALQKAMAPLQVFLKFGDDLKAGQDNRPALWLVNDFPQPFDSLVLTWRVLGPEPESPPLNGVLACAAEPGSLQPLGRLEVPFARPGKYHVALRLESGGSLLAENSYEIIVEI